jgi:hypothetical protein
MTHKVSVPTLKRDAAFARAVDAVAEVGGPDTRQMILAREAKVGRQDVQRLATLAKERPQTAKEVLTAVREASSAKEVKATLATAFGACEICGKTLSMPSSVEAGVGPVCACKPSASAPAAVAFPVAEPAEAPASSPRAEPLTLSLVAHMEEVWAALGAFEGRLGREVLPHALDVCPQLSIALAKTCGKVVHALTSHPLVCGAVFPSRTPPAVAKASPPSKAQKRAKPAKKPATRAGARPSGLLHGTVLEMAERQQRFTCKGLAEAVREEVKTVWQVLQRLLKQEVVRREGDEYVYLGKGASADDQKNQVLKRVERNLNAALKQFQATP